jgi:hypothetical protein
MAKAKAKAKSKAKKKGKGIDPDVQKMMQLESTRKRLLATVIDARDKKESHTTRAASLAAERKEEMDSANKWEKVENEAIEDILKLDGGQFIDRLPFGSTDAPKSDAGKAVTEVASQASPNLPSQAQREKELEGVKVSEFAKGAVLEKLEAAGIRNGMELFKWLNDRFAAPIKGVGESAKSAVGDKLTEWWIAHPYENGKAAPAVPPKTPADKDVPLTKTTPEPVGDQVRDADAVDLINLKGKLILQIAPRRNENLAYGFLLRLDKDHGFEQPWFGHYESGLREKCYRDALDAVTNKLHEWEAGALPIPSIETAKEIHGAIIEAGKLLGKRKRKSADVDDPAMAAAGA